MTEPTADPRRPTEAERELAAAMLNLMADSIALETAREQIPPYRAGSDAAYFLSREQDDYDAAAVRYAAAVRAVCAEEAS